MTTPAELRLANLQVLLAGKGAKSALARLLQLSPASVTGMLNGVKPLDEELRSAITKALNLGENWFDKERTEKDIPAAASKLLSPLPRGATAPTPSPERQGGTKSKANPSADAGANAGSTSGENADNTSSASGADAGNVASGAPATNSTPAVSSDVKPQSWPAGSSSKVAKLRSLAGEAPGTAAEAAGAATQGGAETSGGAEGAGAPATVNQASAAAATPNAQAEGAPVAAKTASKAGGSAASNRQASPPDAGVQVANAPSANATPVQQRGDAIPVVSAVLNDSELSPIAEALIKTLARKALSGALSEDQAFELLGNVRTL